MIDFTARPTPTRTMHAQHATWIAAVELHASAQRLDAALRRLATIARERRDGPDWLRAYA